MESLITIDTARSAKEKGFNLPTEHYYYSGDEKYGTKEGLNKARPYNRNVYEFQYTAPFQSVLQKWLREICKVSVTVKHYTSGTYTYDIQKHNGDATGWTKLSGFMEKGFDKYEKALEVGLQKALEL